MKSLLKGQKLSLQKEIPNNSFIIGLNWDQSSCPSYDIDASLMLLSERGKLEEEEDFIFYNNHTNLNGSVKMHTNPIKNFNKSFFIDLSNIPNNIHRIKFLLTIDNGDQLNQRFNNVKNIKACILDQDSKEYLSYFVDDMTKETAIIVLEIYKRNNEWKLQAVGNGFNSGLSAILKEYGSEKVQISEDTPKQNDTDLLKKNSSQQPISSQTQNTQPPTPSISLSKITLEKKGDSTKIDLNKYDTNQSVIHINLNWNQQKKKSGFFRKEEKLDLDLGAMFEMQDGKKGIVQALGNSFGSKYTFPYIYLDKDDRTGAASDGENIHIYRPDLIKKVVVFSFIYEGNSDYTEADAILSLKGLNQEITIKLDSPRRNLLFCIGALIENINGIIKIQKLDEYVRSHLECDKMFGFNFRWSAGSKD